jgi:hypothetical protein
MRPAAGEAPSGVPVNACNVVNDCAAAPRDTTSRANITPTDPVMRAIHRARCLTDCLPDPWLDPVVRGL